MFPSDICLRMGSHTIWRRSTGHLSSPMEWFPLKVNAVDQNGKDLLGMYMVLYTCSNTPNSDSFATLKDCEVDSSGWMPYPTGIFTDWPHYMLAVSWHAENVFGSNGTHKDTFSAIGLTVRQACWKWEVPFRTSRRYIG